MRHKAALRLLGLGLVFVLSRNESKHCFAEPRSGVETPAQPAYVLLERSTIPSPDGEHPVFRHADTDSEAAQQAAHLLESSYARQALVLHRYVKNFLAHQPGADPAEVSEPTYFVLGGTGGYASLGFWLEGDQGQLIDKRTASYVRGLSVNAGSWGDFEQLFPHELGHAMLAELSGWQEGTLASQSHQVTMLTDYFYAFNEGWAEHFQAVAVDHTTNGDLQALRETLLLVGEQGPYGRLAHDLEGRCAVCLAKASLPLWHDQLEQHLRYTGVKSNLFAHQIIVPDGTLLTSDANAILTYQNIIPPDDKAIVRNGSQMLANEGFIATLFYRMVNDPHLQQSYREPAFYDRFLPPGYEVEWTQTSPQELFGPMDNVYLKLFWVFARYVDLDGDLLGDSPTIMMLKGYATEYPDEAEWLYRIFLETTLGMTVESRAWPMAQDRIAGRLSVDEHQAYLNGLHRQLVAGQLNLDSALGPQIWLRNADVQVGAWALDAYGSILPGPYNFNLNAATVADLHTVPEIDVQLAHEIVQMRDEQGSFHTLDDLANVPGMTPEILERLNGMHQAMYTWIDQGGPIPEDDLEMNVVLSVLAQRLLLQLAVLLAATGLVFVLGTTLYKVTAGRLGLGIVPVRRDSVKGGCRRMLRYAGRSLSVVTAVLATILVPVTAFLVLQLLLLLRDSRFPGVILVLVFGLAMWCLIALPRLIWHFIRGRSRSGGILYRAAWDLFTYIAMIGTVGWLAGA